MPETANNFYGIHLTNFGENEEVIASEDIYNSQGVLLLKKGSFVNKKTADQIIKFKLLKPIESSVSIENSLQTDDLAADLKALFDTYPSLGLIHSTKKLHKPIRDYARKALNHPLLNQKVTVMRAETPKLYQQSLAVSWLSLAIGLQLQLPTERLDHLFTSGLVHDIGMLHIDPNVIAKKESLTPEEWRQIQSHTVIGQKLTENISTLDKNVARIVLEHHERCDGTGYPVGKFGEKLTLESQIIALSDSVISVYLNKFHNTGKGVRDLIPFLQVNSESHFYSAYAAVITILKSIQLEETCFINTKNKDAEIDKLLKKNTSLSQHIAYVEALVFNDAFKCSHKLIASASSIIQQILKTVRGSGVLDEGYIRWLKQVREQTLEHAFREIADVSLMLDELEWQLNRATKILNSFIHMGPETETQLKQVIKESLYPPKEEENMDEYSI